MHLVWIQTEHSASLGVVGLHNFGILSNVI